MAFITFSRRTESTRRAAQWNPADWKARAGCSIAAVVASVTFFGVQMVLAEGYADAGPAAALMAPAPQIAATAAA